MQELGSSPAAAEGSDSAPAEPHEQTNDTARLREDVRRLLRKVPASVAVITVAHVDPKTNETVPMGIAVSSLSSVTLDPPTISFNIKKPSQALDAIRHANGRFRVHWLNGNDHSLKVIEHFCKGNNHDAYEVRRKELRIDLLRSEHGSSTASSAPRIRGPAVRAAAECTSTHEFDVGDHVILVAQVTHLDSDDRGAPTIVYVDGTYRKLDSLREVLGRHQDHQGSKQSNVQQQDAASMKQSSATRGKNMWALNRAQELSIAYDWHVIPGEAERGEYANRLASYLKDALGSRNVAPHFVAARLQPETVYLARSLGVDLHALIADCLNKDGNKEREILPEFYDRLSPSTLAKLGDRMTQFVKADRRFLDLPHKALLNYLSVAVSAVNLLPSDLLEPLRAEGLLPPFEPSASLLKQSGVSDNVLVLEQVEHALRRELSPLSDDEKMRTSLPVLLKQAQLPTANNNYLKAGYIKLKITACKSYSKIQRHDIAGELTPEEARVLTRRLVDFMGVEREQVFRERMALNLNTLLARVGVHPSISGINVHFIVGKIRHLYSTTPNFSDLQTRVEEMLQPNFDSKVTWGDLESRIEHFVQKFPLRAVTWVGRDVLAAIGLSERTLISTPLAETPKTIKQSGLLNMLMAKALKKHYGNGTEEENQAIATWFNDRYGVDVTSKAFAATPAEEQERSSADDMEAAMLHYKRDTIPIS